MVKVARGCLISLLLLFTVSGNIWAGQSSGMGTDLEKKETRIEQVYVNRPEVTVYGTGLSGAGKDTVESFLGQEPLEWVSAIPFSESGEGIYYYVLLDISGSMPQSYFESIKEGILNLKRELSEKDKLVLCTFGEQIKVYGDGNQTIEELEAALNSLSAKDQKTLLFEGIDRAAEMAAKIPANECMRKVLVVISDGEDIAVGQKMSKEALTTLKETGIPAYAVCISDTDRSNINSFGEFARTSGGDILIFEANEGTEILRELQTGLMSHTEIKLRTGNNIVTNGEETFSLKLLTENLILTKEVMDLRWIPDTTAPELVKAVQTGERQMILSFSEAVTGLDSLGNYIITKGETAVPVSGVAPEKETDNSVVLTLTEPFADGDYTISCRNITDKTMEKNIVTNSLTVLCKAVDVPADEPVTAPVNDNSGLLFLLVMAVVVLIIVLLVRYKKIKEGKGILYIDGKPVLASEVEVHEHVAITQEEKMTLNILAGINGRSPEPMKWKIGSSLIVGRANICDVYFDDKQMSRQHFALEREGECLYVTDLQTTNGTMVNGVRIKEKHRLERGDKILAGTLEITIRW